VRKPKPVAAVAARPAPAPDGKRRFFDGRTGQAIEIPLYRREGIEAGMVVPGPAVIAERETSTFIAGSYDARIDGAGCIVMERRAS
jgi:N-methylhydantoinase A